MDRSRPQYPSCDKNRSVLGAFRYPQCGNKYGRKAGGVGRHAPGCGSSWFSWGPLPDGGLAELSLARQRRIWSATDSPHSRPRRLCGPCRIPASVALWSSSKVSAFAGKSVKCTLCAASLAAASCEAVIEVRKDSFILESVKFRDELRMSLRSGRQVTASVPCTSSLRKTLCQVVVCRSTDIDFEAWDIAPWTGWHGACRSLFRRTPGSRSPLCRFVSPQFLFRLNAVSLYDRRNQSWKALVDFRASRRVVHLDASPFATN